MPSERVQRRIDRLLDQAEEAADTRVWPVVIECSEGVLALDAVNADALAFIEMANRAGNASPSSKAAQRKTTSGVAAQQDSDTPSSFVSGRYTVSKFLGEGGKKKVYLAHDNTLDRDVAFALIKTEGLDETSRERVKREAQAMGRMGTHPSIMPIYDLGEEIVGTSTQPYMVQPVMVGGDVEGLVEEADGPLALERAIEIATQTAQGLSFAHGKGIVHRDLKPGNVWLDEDGAAKIGDFGLAVATDRSRLTVEKVMVGTVSYMPPEQATGGDVTPRADLYSLGAMLYEMCTGRVPFMGDDDIGIISQHINTPPVAPSWHNNQIPKTLDSLILRLLSKDPAERPSDADEVLAALEAVDLSAVEEREEESRGSLDAMAGGVFVGRHREMDQLKSIFEYVLSGRGRMVTLVGEPGIGKTRTAQELATYASMRGAEVLWGRSYESGGAPPYWPWVQAIRSHIAATEPDDLRSQMGSSASVVAEVITDVKEKLPDLPEPTPIEDPESARFRLFDSISTFLKQVSSATPLVVMLEDMHWSDKPSLLLLEFVARELANSKLMIVGNYRDMELNRRHPLSVTLGDLTRERLFERVVLRGLQRHDVERFIEIAAGIVPPAALVDTVHSQTEGNPLFVTETVRLLIQEGDIASGQETRSGTTSWEVRIPEGVREVIGRRLDRLSERCNEVLTMAAVIGRQFRFDVLKMLVEDTTESQLLDAVDEALDARIIDELPDEVGLYQFTHASMQETLTSELSHTRSVRMHARIAEALETHYGDDAHAHAEQLVDHFAEAETVLGSHKVVMYALAAGRAAMNAMAPEDALEFFQSATSIFSDDITKDEEADCIAGEAVAGMQVGGRDSRRPWLEKLGRATDYYIGRGRPDLIVPSLLMINEGFDDEGATELLERTLFALPETAERRLELRSRYARMMIIERDALDKGAELLDEILKEAQKSEDLKLQARALADYAVIWSRRSNPVEGLRDVNRALKINETLDDDLISAELIGNAVAPCMALGKLDEARNHVDRGLLTARRLGIRDRIDVGEICDLFIHIVRGEFAAARQKLGADRDIDMGLFSTETFRAMLDFLTGETESAEKRTQWLVENHLGEGLFARNRGVMQSTIGYLSMFVTRAEVTGTVPDATSALLSDSGNSEIGTASRATQPLGLLASIAIVEDDVELAEYCASELAQSELIFDALYPTNYWIAGVQAVLGNRHESRSKYESSIKDARVAGFRPAMATCMVKYLEQLVSWDASGDREKAIELQDEAISIATELGMKPLLERVLAKREILKA